MLDVFAMLLDQSRTELLQTFPYLRSDFLADKFLDGLFAQVGAVDFHLKLS